MKNKNKTVWSNRFKSKTSQSFQKIGSSIHIDKRLYEQGAHQVAQKFKIMMLPFLLVKSTSLRSESLNFNSVI